MSQSSATAAQQELVSPEETQEGEESLTSNSHQTAATPHGKPPEDTQDMNTGYWSQIAEEHIKEIISGSPDFCTFPYIEKYQIPQDIWF